MNVGFGKRAVSPLLATIILIAITIAAGATIYMLYSNAATRAATQLAVQVQSLDLVATSSTNIFSATIKNTGDKPISSISITIYLEPTSGSTPVAWTMSASGLTLQTGQVWSNTLNALPAGAKAPTIGYSYPATISVTAADGSKFDKATTVVCSG
ncbi:MAG: archaellin/type IV pilin N-terminal domain-containing protein [Candidatus Bathyarchaeia archaeon]